MEINNPVSGQKRKHGTSSPKVVQLQIDRVIGLSPPNAGTVAYCPINTDVLCYPAGSFAVVFSSSSKQQLRLLRSTTSNAALSCVAWSGSGEHIAAGEAGPNPSISIWDWSSSKCIHELKGHKQSIASARFSPDGKLLLSAGGAHDGQLCMWDWRAGSVLWRQSVAAELSSAVFTEDSSCVLAVGKGIFKAWSVNTNAPARAKATVVNNSSSSSSSGSLSLTPRPVTLREFQRSTFVDVCMAPCQASQPAGNNGVYALVNTGVLVLMRPTGRTIDKSVNLQVQAAFALAAAPTQVAAACAQGVVRLFSSKTLTFRATLPRFVAKGQGQATGGEFPDARGCSFQPGSEHYLVVVYADASIIVWNIQDIKKVTCVLSLAAHNSCVWDICPISAPALSPGGFQQQPARCATCAADGTVRLWNLAADTAAGTGRLIAAAVDAQGKPAARLRCMRISPDGRHISIGDQAGNLRVYDSVSYKLIVQQPAHDNEVLCLDYSPLGPGSSCLAASGSRDMLIHVFDAQQGYELLETLDDHTAAVTGVRFTAGGRGLVSCGADRSIIFRVLGGAADGGTAAYHIETLPHSVLYDLAVDPLDQYVFTTGQDGLLRQWDVASGNHQRTLAPEAGAGEPIKLYIDPGGVVLICCHADGCLRLYHLATGQLLWRAWGHSEMVAAASLSADLTQMVSVGGDGCVIVWKLPEQLVQEVQAAVARVSAAKKHLETASQQHEAKQDSQHSTADSGRQIAWSDTPAAADSPVREAGAALATPPAVSMNGSSSTGPGTSDSGISSTLLRVRQGKPLVSTDKLPKWARSPASGGPLSPQAIKTQSGLGTEQQQQPTFSRWHGGRQAMGKWQAAQELVLHADTGSPVTVEMGGDGLCRRLSLESGDASNEGSRRNTGKLSDADDGQQRGLAMQQQESGWPQEDDMVVIQDWDDSSSLVQYDADAAAAAAMEETSKAAEEPAAAGGEDVGVQQQQTSAAEQGGARVVRDLFKEHFSSLGGCDPSSLQRQSHEFRQSLSAMFKAGRSSLGGLLPTRSQGLSSAGGADVHADRGPQDGVEGGASPQPLSANGGIEADAPVSEAATALLQPSSQGGFAGLDVGDEQLVAGPSPKKRWRHGKMDAELAGMRERLANLQALYQQQLLQRQISPRRGRSSSSSDEQVQPPAQLAAQQGSSTQPGSAKRSKVAEECMLADFAKDSASTEAGVSLEKSHVLGDSCSPGEQDATTITAAAVAAPAAVKPVARMPSKKSVLGGGGGAPPPLPPGPVPAAALSTGPGKPKSYAAAVAASPPAGPVARHELTTASSAAPERPAEERAEAATAAEKEAETQAHQGIAAAAAAVAAANTVAQQSAVIMAAGERPCSVPISADKQPADTRAAGSDAAGSTPTSPVVPASSNLLAQLLSNSPEPPSPEHTNSPESIEAAAAAGRHAPSPLSMAATFDAVAAASPCSQAGSGAGSSTASPTTHPAAWLHSHTSSLFGDSVYRVSIGTSIAAADGAGGSSGDSQAGAVRSGSPTQWSLSLQMPRAAGSSHSASASVPHSAAASPRDTATTPTAKAGDVAAAAAAVESGGAATCAEQELAASDTALASGTSCAPSEEAVSQGATATPYGQHVVWPGWGAHADAWEGLTPSPAGLAAAAGAADGLPAADGVATDAAAEGDEGRYCVLQNPCYDMTPLGSTPGSALASSNGRASCAAGAQADAVADNGAAAASQPSAAATQHSMHAGQRQQQQEAQQQEVLLQLLEPETPQPAQQQPSSPLQLGLQQPTGLQELPLEPEIEQAQGYTPVQLKAPQLTQQQVGQEQPVMQQQQAGQQLGLATPQLFQGQEPHVQSGAPSAESSYTTAANNSRPTSPPSASLTPTGAGIFSFTASTGSSSSKGKSRSQARREKAAAKAAVKAAKAAAAAANSVEGEEHGSPNVSSPGSSMMSLLQRIKRTMPSIRSRPSSSSGGGAVSGFSCTSARASSTHSPEKGLSPAASSASSCPGAQQGTSPQDPAANQGCSAVGVERLGAWVTDRTQQQRQQQSSSGAADGPIALDDVTFSIEEAVRDPAANAPLPGPLADEQARAGQQQQAPGSAIGGVAVDSSTPSEAPSAVKRRTAAQLAASVEHFKQSVQEMQQLWMQLQSLSLDHEDACALQQLLTPHKPNAAAGETRSAEHLAGGVPAGAPGITPSGPGSSVGSAEPVQKVKQVLQEELLHSIWDLHATLTGAEGGSGSHMPAGAGQVESPARTPLRTNSSSPLQPRQLHSTHSAHKQGCSFSSPAQGAADFMPGSPALSLYSNVSQAGMSIEDFTSRICEQYTETLLRKLEERRQQKHEDRKHSPAKQRQRHRQQQPQSQHQDAAASL